jgi:DNA-binding NarL/FixJ family response regulator
MLWRLNVALGRVLVAQRRRAAASAVFNAARALVQQLADTLPDDDPLRATFLSEATSRLPRLRPVSGRRASRAMFGGLTERERQVAALIGRARTNAEIAHELVLGERTVETHVGNILAKLGGASRRDVAAWAIAHGL